MKNGRSIKKMVWLLFCVLLGGNVLAQQVYQTEAVNVAINSIVKMYPERQAEFSKTTVDNVFELKDKGNSLIYEICFNCGVRVLLSGNKSCVPILAYIDNVVTDFTQSKSILSFGEDVPDGLKQLLNDYADQNRYCFDNLIEDESIISLWDALQQSKTDRSTTEVLIPPLLSTRWGQSYSNDEDPSFIDYYAYNYYAPNGNDCPQHCYAGCGAVAMAQIMRYWREPQDVPSRCVQFDWSNMTGMLIKKSNNTYVNQRNAVAKLIYDCGEATGMQYCTSTNLTDPCASGNTIYNTKTGFRLFGYSNVSLAVRGSDDNEWMGKIYEELYNDRPVYYVAYQTSNMGGGHAFVCDGYYKDGNNNKFFHFNWGWNGHYDGFYSISNLNPNNYTFNYSHRMLYDVFPTDCWRDISMECDKIYTNGTIKQYSASGSFSNNNYKYNIESGAGVLLQAGNEIDLTHGFSAEAGSEFYAWIAPCSTPTRENGFSMDDNDGLYEGIEDLGKEYAKQVQFFDYTLDMKIYPNPVTGTFNVLLGDPYESIKLVDVLNTLGSIVYRSDNVTAEGIDVSSVPQGVYVVRVLSDKGNVYFGKFVKAK